MFRSTYARYLASIFLSMSVSISAVFGCITTLVPVDPFGDPIANDWLRLAPVKPEDWTP